MIGDLYKPGDATAAHPDPAILTTNGFGGSKNNQATMAKELASDGTSCSRTPVWASAARAARSSSTRPTGTARPRRS